MQIKSFPSQDAQVTAVAEAVIALVENNQREMFNLVVTGGGLGIRTIQQLGKLVKDPSRLRILFCDERFVTSASPDRNEAQALLAWPTITLSDFVIYPQPTKPVQAAAKEFSAKLEAMFGDIASSESAFDLVLLGMGEDGHVASLFPNSSHPPAWVVAETNSPKPPIERLSLSYEALNRSERVWFVVGGASKTDAIRLIQAGKNLPASKVRGSKETIWWLDQELSDAL
jgi:6-phosphogluconolactonase